jgi:hypothetical protein
MRTVKPNQQITPKLQSLTLRDLDVLLTVQHQLLDTLEKRSRHHVGLKNLVVHSCRVTTSEYAVDLRDRVKKVTWENVEEMGSDFDGTEPEVEPDYDDFDESDESDYWYPHRAYRHYPCF